MPERWIGDINNLSTETLVAIWCYLGQEKRRASAEGFEGVAREYAVRQEAVDLELSGRQLTIDDELARLRAQNELTRRQEA